VFNFELKYCRDDPLASDLLLDLVEDGLLLRFEPRSQRLRTVEVYDATKLKLSYANASLSKPGVAPSLVLIINHFGPTYPGSFDAARSVYRLSYPGVAFEFLIPPQHAHAYQRPASVADLPLEFDDGSSPPVARIIVLTELHQKDVLSSTSLLSSSSLPPAVDCDEILVHVGVGIQRGADMLTFASSSQDVLSLLGQPNRVHVKQHDKLRIHSASLAAADAVLADYFYNYFDLGIDLLFDGQRHCVKKIILHTNLPSHTEFNRYAKCFFRVLVTPPAAAPDSDDGDGSDGDASGDGSSGSGGSSGGGDGGAVAKGVIGPNTRFEHVQQLLGPVASQPVVHNRGASENPFGALLFYGYDHMIFEVTQNGYVASLCLFE
jgi:uncharacterized membrane protein YgcG